MTAPLHSSPAPNNRHWLLRYLRLQQASDKRVDAALNDALDSAVEALSALEGKAGVSAAVQRAQLLGTRGVLTKALKELYKELGDIIKSDQMEAAEIATELLYEDEKHIWAVIEPNKEKREQIEESQKAKARRNVQTMMIKTLGLEIPLSRRLYKSEALANKSVERVVLRHLSRGSSAKDLAKDVRDFFNPKTSGGVAHLARRLARSEIVNAFHAQSKADALERPWIDEVRWNLSKSHPPRQPECDCDRNARTGTFPVDSVPNKPHPNCLCFITAVIRSFDEVFREFNEGKFGDYLGRM